MLILEEAGMVERVVPVDRCQLRCLLLGGGLLLGVLGPGGGKKEL